VLRQVREENAEYVITHQGRPVALILAVNSDAVEDAMVEASKANLVGGGEAYARLVSGQAATSRALKTPSSSRPPGGPAGASSRQESGLGRRQVEPFRERASIGSPGPDILD
jgi:antitoxin (DNA-binding transcriptional repressor) of toxin-antitoxin stability system